MDIDEKRVLRRKTGVIAEVVKFNSRLAAAAISQGLLKENEGSILLAQRSNKNRISKFFQLLENLPGSQTVFEKLCYLLEHHGYPWLADELNVELCSAKGDLPIEPGIYTRVKRILHDQLGVHTELQGEQLEELAWFVATRCQIIKQTLQRQEARIAVTGDKDKKLANIDVFDVVSNVCLKMLHKTGITQHRGSSWNNSNSDSTHDETLSPLTSRPIPNDGSKGVNNLFVILMKEINDATNIFVSSRFSSHSPRKIHRLSEGNFNTTQDFSEMSGIIPRFPHNREPQNRPLDSSCKLEHPYTNIQTTSSGLVARTKPPKDIKCYDKPSLSRKKTNKMTNDDNNDDVTFTQINFEFTEHEIESSKAILEKEILRLERHKTAVEQFRLSGKSVDRSRIEKAFWTERNRVMSRCQSVGYYYFLSDRKQVRCDGCKEIRSNRCTWETHGCTSDSKHISPNLYERNCWVETTPTEHYSFEDGNCPGAVLLRGRSQRRCLACAYANNDEASFYDATVDPNGRYRMEIPRIT